MRIRRSTFVIGVFATLLAAGAAVGFTRASSGTTEAAPAGPSIAAPGEVAALGRSSTPIADGHGVIVGHAVAHSRTPLLRTLPVVPFKVQPEREVHRNPPVGSRHPDAPDPVVQHRLARPNMPSPILNFDGIPFPGVACNCAPPDTNGEVGATQYVQDVNIGFQVFDKSTGTSVFGPVDIATLWQTLGGTCFNFGDGDPVVLYDQLANRWVITQFAGSSVPTDECIAVSTTSDATGSYNAYDFHLGTDFFDYPKFGVWPDAYYMSMNVFNSAATAFLGVQPFAFDRAAMLAGNPSPTFVTFRSAPFFTPSADAFMPADVDGPNEPPAGAPNPFLTEGVGATWPLYRFHADFATPANSTFTLAANLSPAAYTSLCPGFSCSRVPQLGSSFDLDTLGDRGMFRNAYRNFGGGREALVGNISVSSGGVAGIRWFELDNVTSGSPTFVQQSTYQPDTTYRWMGSAAMDGVGDLAVGFSASSGLIHPEIRYAGRLASDPLGQLAQGEATLFAGAGSQTGTNNRWGDYSDMTVDPTDDCTFWYTQEYYATTSQFNWRTRIGSFKFPTCAVTRLTAAKAGSGSGSITSIPAGVSCGATCLFEYPQGATVTLNATADPSSVFAGWSGGGCSGTGACTVTLNADTTVTATFAALRTLTVSRSGSGSGTVTSAPAGIACGATCSALFVDGTPVALTATAAAGSKFTGWSGDCTGTGACTLTMSAGHAVTASFAKVPKCKVPKLVGLTLKKARAKLLRAHCRLGKVTRKASSLKKKGRVLSQRPKPGKSLKSGSKVNVTVGRGRR